MQFTPIPDVLQIVGNRLLVRPWYEEFSNRSHKTLRQITNEKNLRSAFPSGLVTRKIRQRMTKIIDVWIKSMSYSNFNHAHYRSFKPTFVTLTLPSTQVHTDKELHQKALNRFIIAIQRRYKVKYYLWRAERQKNGSLHYHIIIDKFIGYLNLRGEWNSIMKDLGYIVRYRQSQKKWHRNGFRVREHLLDTWTLQDQAEAYNEGCRTDWQSPNSTDVHGLRNVSDVTTYIAKYCTKDEEYREYMMLKKAYQSGQLSEEQFNASEKVFLLELEKSKIHARVWGCSDELRSISEPKILMDWKEKDMFEEAINLEDSKVITGEGFTVVYVKDMKKLLKKHLNVAREINQHYKSIYHTLYAPIKEIIWEPEPPPLQVHIPKKHTVQAVLFANLNYF